jgi:hypothetical protein
MGIMDASTPIALRPEQFRSLKVWAERTGKEQDAVLDDALRAYQFVQAFTPGDIVVYRVGDASSTDSQTAKQVFLQEYTPGGQLVQSVAIAAASGIGQAIDPAPPETFLARLTRFGFVGQFDSAPSDLSTNPEHMEGFGR